jgi:Raf kinase inhibitor-like YbhB/YbcL family protein
VKLPLLLACLLTMSCADADGAGTGAAGSHALASDRAETKTAHTLRLNSPAFPDGGEIPLAHSAYGDGRSPALNWSNLPKRARSLALLMEDPDATSARPFVHWLAWNIEPSLSGLPEGIPARTELSELASLRQGRNSRGSKGYFGPRPHGSKPHHYHFQLFALDDALSLAAGSKREDLLAAMDGHVIAKGELVGLFAQPRK